MHFLYDIHFSFKFSYLITKLFLHYFQPIQYRHDRCSQFMCCYIYEFTLYSFFFF